MNMSLHVVPCMLCCHPNIMSTELNTGQCCWCPGVKLTVFFLGHISFQLGFRYKKDFESRHIDYIGTNNLL